MNSFFSLLSDKILYKDLQLTFFRKDLSRAFQGNFSKVRTKLYRNDLVLNIFGTKLLNEFIASSDAIGSIRTEEKIDWMEDIGIRSPSILFIGKVTWSREGNLYLLNLEKEVRFSMF